MTQYAAFDSTQSDPKPVIGWYDTGFATYPNLPVAANLLEMTPAQWAARMTGSWAVSSGALVAYTPPAPPPPTLAQQAATLLPDTDITMHRITEAVSLDLNALTNADVVAWVTYRRELRAIAGGAPASALPTKPAYPAGT